MRFSELIAALGNGLIGGLNFIIKVIASPMAYLFQLLTFIFMFIVKAVTIVFLFIQIVYSIIMFLVSLSAGIFRTIKLWLNPQFNKPINFPSESESGFGFVMELLEPTGLITTIPNVVICLLWFAFAMKTFYMLATATTMSSSRTPRGE